MDTRNTVRTYGFCECYNMKAEINCQSRSPPILFAEFRSAVRYVTKPDSNHYHRRYCWRVDQFGIAAVITDCMNIIKIMTLKTFRLIFLHHDCLVEETRDSRI